MVVRPDGPNHDDADQTLRIHPDEPKYAGAAVQTTMKAHPIVLDHADTISVHEIPDSPVTPI